MAFVTKHVVTESIDSMGPIASRDWKPQAVFFESKKQSTLSLLTPFGVLASFWCTKASVVQVVDATGNLWRVFRENCIAIGSSVG